MTYIGERWEAGIAAITLLAVPSLSFWANHTRRYPESLA